MIKIKPYELFFEKVGEVPISNINKYTNSLKSSMKDKIFWIDKIDTDVIVDFGCADGSVIREVSNILPDVKVIGYDIDDNMIRLSRSNNPGVLITNNWNDIERELEMFRKPSILLSSVIHEVYSYSHPNDINKFWKNIFSGKFNNIIIRDMMTKQSSNKFIDRDDIDKIRQKADPITLDMFEKQWGPIDRDYRNLLHFLLKYRYVENFDREMKEYYLPLTIETLESKIPSGFRTIYKDLYILPFLSNKIYDDFGIDIKQPTHIKMIISKVE